MESGRSKGDCVNFIQSGAVTLSINFVVFSFHEFRNRQRPLQ